MGRIVTLGAYQIIIYAKEDGNARDKHHPAQTNFLSVTQTHQLGIYQTIGTETYGQLPIEADAIISCQNVSIGTYMADCLPLVIVSPTHTAVVHCSRKTLYGGLVQQVLFSLLFQGVTLETMQCRLGPCIKTYEVGAEFINYFPAPFLSPRGGDKYFFDMVGYTCSVLQYSGLSANQITVDPVCTFESVDYRSRRRGEKGRNFIGVRKKEW